MQNEPINRWVMIAGFAALGAVLTVEALALFGAYSPGAYSHLIDRHLQPMVKFLFDRHV